MAGSGSPEEVNGQLVGKTLRWHFNSRMGTGFVGGVTRGDELTQWVVVPLHFANRITKSISRSVRLVGDGRPVDRAIPVCASPVFGRQQHCVRHIRASRQPQPCPRQG